MEAAVVYEYGAPIETVEYCESIAQTTAGLAVSVEGVHFGRDASYSLVTTPTEAWTPTGDVLGSLKCDCGPQLRAALAAMAAEAEWLAKGYFAPTPDPSREPFVIIMPPPIIEPSPMIVSPFFAAKPQCRYVFYARSGFTPHSRRLYTASLVIPVMT